METLTYQGTLSALQALLGRKVSVTFGNFAANDPAFAGFAGRLGYAERPPDEQVEIVGGQETDRIYTFFAGPDEPFNRDWFTLDERRFERGVRIVKEGDVEEQVTITNAGANIVVTVPTNAYLRGIGVEP